MYIVHSGLLESLLGFVLVSIELWCYGCCHFIWPGFPCLQFHPVLVPGTVYVLHALLCLSNCLLAWSPSLGLHFLSLTLFNNSIITIVPRRYFCLVTVLAARDLARQTVLQSTLAPGPSTMVTWPAPTASVRIFLLFPLLYCFF